MKDMTISTELANAVPNYLANRPYLEAFTLINALQAAAPKDDVVEQ